MIYNLSELIKKLVRKDRQAQKVLFEEYAPLLLSVSRRYSPKNMDPLDNLHDSFIKIFEKISLFDPKKGSFENWSSRIVINTALEKLRKKSFDFEEEIEFYADSTDDFSIFEKLAVEDIMNVIATLPDGYKQVFCLYEIEGFRHKEIAEILGIKEVNSRSNLFRAKEMLREILTSNNYDRKWMII